VKVIQEPNDPAQLAAHWKKEAKAKKITFDSMKNHFISHIVEKTSKDMFGGVSQRMLLRNQLSTICMSKTDTMVNYLTRITQLRNQLAATRTQVEEQELVSISMNGLVPSWMPFV
jgi:hypothetical protein